MGWTSMHREPGQTDAEFFTNLLGDDSGEFLETYSRGCVFYAAWKLGPRFADWDGNQEGKVIGFVALYKRTRDHWNFTYKDMTEESGPCDYGCPDSILDRLSPTDSEYALQWRASCREANAKRRARPKLRPGSKVRFDVPLEFTDGVTRDEFTFEQRTTFRATDGMRVRISNWRARDFVLLEDAA